MSQQVAHEPNWGRRLRLIGAAALAVAVSISFGQIIATKTEAPTANPAAAIPAFEVASIKPDKSAGNGPVMLRFTPNGFIATNIPLKMLIREAYGVEENQILGAPSWLNSHSYDIEAKVDSAAMDDLRKLSLDQRRLMFRPLLAERFGLKTHRETKELPVFELMIAKNGPKFHEAKPGDTYPNGVKGPDGHSGPGMIWIQDGKLTCQAIPMSGFTRILSDRLGHNVFDKTGLTGNYDFTMQWPPEDESAGTPPAPPGSQEGAPPAEATGPSIYTVIQEQLGLKLESHKAPVEVLVIDHIDPPSEN
jgi:uncharacterized protein (TIGR03435 family)